MQVLTQFVSLVVNEMMLMHGMLLTANDVYNSCRSLISPKVAHAENVQHSDARARRLRFRVVYSASVLLDSDTHSCRNPYRMPVVYTI